MARVLNLGTSKGASVLEVVSAVEAPSERNVPYAVVARRPVDAAITVASPTLATKRLGWRTRRSLAAVHREGWAWQSANPQSYQ